MAFGNDDSPQRMLVIINAIDLTNMAFTAWNQSVGQVMVTATLMPGATFVVPSVGEQWMVDKIGGRWFLRDKSPFQDRRLALPPEEGMTAVGNNGPTYIVGTEVHLPEIVALGDWELRIEPNTGALQVRERGTETWTGVTGGGDGGGTVTSTEITDATATGRSLITAANAAAGRTTLGAAASANAKGFVNHGTNAAAARPSGYASVEWYGSVAPTNATSADTWVNTA